MKLAVVDWGIGGLGFHRRFAQAHPAIPVVYCSDTGFTPYGKVPRRDLAARLDRILAYISGEHGADHAVLACNAASTVIDDLAAPGRGMPVAGVIAPAVAALAKRAPTRVGVIGGGRTIRSGLYGRGLRGAGHHVRQRVAQPLSAHVEAGRLDTDDVRRDVARITAPLADVEILVLACTHYVALAPLLSERCPRADLYDPVSATLGHVERDWAINGTPGSSAEPARFVTTGDPDAMRRSAELAFGIELPTVEGVTIGV
ncbi:MAG TPA: aspartate/glutamate racemase family protein [Longimicrobium sp.]|nr:aspartate/glutamate racemase family protein [Longimicrobium sp.]